MTSLAHNYLLVGVLLGFTLTGKAQTTEPASLTTAAKPVLESSGKTAMPASLTTLGLPSMSSLKEQKDAYVASVADLGLKLKQLKKIKENRKSKAKLSKTEYEGLSMIKAYTKIGSGDRTIVEEFHVLKDNNAAKPATFVRDVYRYYQRTGRVSSAVVKDEGSGLLLHGPYKRFQNGDLIEEGNYYAGMKDGRWERYDSHFMLVDKTHWRRGVPDGSIVSFYDSTRTKIREIVPMEYGKVKGTYMAFHENGLLAEEGKYDNGIKIGRWTEFYPISPSGRRMRKKVMQYGSDQWDTNFEPYVISEWDEKGKATYERGKEKVVEEEEASN